MRLALCGGGTGGHVYPALSIAGALRQELSNGASLETLYFGSEDGVERELAQRAAIDFRAISAAPIRGRNPWQLARNATQMAKGVAEARRGIAEFGAEVVFSTGGYVSFPVALAARSRAIPIVLHLPDVYPGWAVQAIAKLASRISVSTPESLRRLPARKSVVTGYPVRDEFWEASRAEGRRLLSLEGEERVLLVAGASQGAHSINRATADNLRSLLQMCEVVHVSGVRDEPWLIEAAADLPADLRARYHLFGYLHKEMPWAMAAADLALCRSGASTIGELPAVGLPAVLVPYPYAGAHQRLNARYLADNGAAVILEDDALSSMLSTVKGLLDDSSRLEDMKQASHRLARPDAARKIARLVIEAAGGSTGA